MQCEESDRAMVGRHILICRPISLREIRAVRCIVQFLFLRTQQRGYSPHYLPSCFILENLHLNSITLYSSLFGQTYICQIKNGFSKTDSFPPLRRLIPFASERLVNERIGYYTHRRIPVKPLHPYNEGKMRGLARNWGKCGDNPRFFTKFGFVFSFERNKIIPPKVG